MDFLLKTIFHFKKIKIIIVSGESRSLAVKSIFHILKNNFKVKSFVEKTPNIFDVLTKDVLLFETNLENQKISKKLAELIKLSPLPILVATHLGEIPKESNQIYELAQSMPLYGFLVFNFDDKAVNKINDIVKLKSLTFGFEQGADFMASDININGGTNFKINYNGKIIPIWQDSAGKEYVYSALATSCVGTILGLNLVEISEALKSRGK